MRVRNNSNGDYPLSFVDGHTIHLSRAEISRELTEEEMTDSYFVKALRKKKIVPYREPQKKMVKPEPEPEPKPKSISEDIVEKKPARWEKPKMAKVGGKIIRLEKPKEEPTKVDKLIRDYSLEKSKEKSTPQDGEE